MSGFDFDGCADGGDSPDFADLVVVEGDAACCPVAAVLAVVRQFIGLAVDKDIAPCGIATFAGAFEIFGQGVVDAERQMKRALWVAAVDFVPAFGGFAVAFADFVASGREVERDLVDAHGLTVLLQDHFVGGFFNQDVINCAFNRGLDL